MKKQMFKVCKNALLIFLVGIIFSVIYPTISFGQYVVSGDLFTYLSATNENDTTGLMGTNVKVKFYKMNSYDQLVWVATAPVSSDGKYSTSVNTSQELYAVIFGNDIDPAADNFVTSYYPGYTDFESAETIDPTETDTYDWGAVGKEIVERPSVGSFNVSGKISLAGTSDFVPMVYAFQGDMPVKSGIVNSDGTYNLSLSEGEYEIFVSAPGFESQSKFINLGATKNFNANFALNVYRGESSTTTNLAVVNNYMVSQNYPNPFNPTTSIKYTMPESGLVNLTVYNMLGKEIITLINRYQEAGSYSVEFNASSLASGVYVYSLKVGNQTITKKMNLVK